MKSSPTSLHRHDYMYKASFTATYHELLLIGVQKLCAIEIAKNAQKISSLIAKNAQMQGAPIPNCGKSHAVAHMQY